MLVDAGLTVNGTGAENDPAKFLSPLYVAITEYEPAADRGAVHDATLPEDPDVTVTPPQRTTVCPAKV